MLRISPPGIILPLFFQCKKRARQEPQTRQDQSKRNDECDQQICFSVHSSYSETLRKSKYDYNHYCQAQQDGQGSLNGALKIAHPNIHASAFMFTFDFSCHGACYSLYSKLRTSPLDTGPEQEYTCSMKL